MDDIDNSELEAIDIDKPLDESESTTPHQEFPHIVKQKRPKKTRVIVIASIIVALLVLGFLYYWFVLRENTTTDTSADTTPVAAVAADTKDYAKELIDKVRASEASLKKDYPYSNVQNGQASAPAYMYGSNLYYVSGSFGQTLSITNSGTRNFNEAFNTAGEQGAISVLDKEALIKKDREFLATYINDNVICTVSHSSYPVYISCANTRDYQAPSETVKPYAEAYFATPNAADKSQIVFGQPTVTKKSDGYNNATVSIGSYQGAGGFAGLFYGKNEEWTYWQGTQSEIACGDYDTYALQKSFEGNACFVQGQSQDSVVIVTLKS